MQHIPQTDIGFAHAVRYRDAMVRAWATRTGRASRGGWLSYKPEDVPAYIDQPTNEERGRAELIEFVLRPLVYGKPYGAYLSTERDSNGKFRITTWVGGLLATVTSVSERGYKAIGIDGRSYYGRQNGTGMFCTLRLSKYATEFDVQMRGAEGWETVCSGSTWSEARADIRSYRENAPEYAYRIKRGKVRQ